MKVKFSAKAVWLPLVLGGVGVLLIPILLRRPEPGTSPAPATPRAVSVRADVPPGSVSSPAPLRAQPPADPVLQQWKTAIRQHKQKDLLESQAALVAREGEYRDPLMKAATEDPDPRIRAFALTALGKMTSAPPESFFIDRLGDLQEGPRISALSVLERIGSAACLPGVDRLASADREEGVRAAAAKAAKAVRSR